MNKKLIFRQARISTDNKDFNLQMRLQALMKKLNKVSLRLQKTSNENQVIAINRSKNNHKGVFCAELIEYTKGRRQLSARVNLDEAELNIEALSPVDKDSQFLDGILYFGVYKNSLILSQSQALKVQQLENYLNWILAKHDEAVEEEFIILSPPVKKAIADDLMGAKGIEFTAPAYAEPVRQTALNVEQNANVAARIKSLKINLKGKGAEIIDLIIGNSEWAKELSSAMMQDKDSLDVKVYVSLPTGTRIKNQVNAISKVANAMRHVDEQFDYKINTTSGTITQDGIKVEKIVNVKTLNNGLLDLEDLWDKIYLWYEDILKIEWFTNDA